MELFDLSGKVAIVTGSSKGIGRAIAEQFAAHGASVAISSRTSETCEAVTAEINARHPGRAISAPANIASKAALRSLVDRTREAFGKIDIVVCNAATNPFYGPMSAISDGSVNRSM